MAFKPIDGKRDEFRKYLERTGVLDAISKVFVKLVNCKERPENAIEFIRDNLGDTLLQNDTIDHLKQELEDARSEIAQLKRTAENLKAELSKNHNVTTENYEIIASSTNTEEVPTSSESNINSTEEQENSNPPTAAAAATTAIESSVVVPATVSVPEQKNDPVVITNNETTVSQEEEKAAESANSTAKVDDAKNKPAESN